MEGMGMKWTPVLARYLSGPLGLSWLIAGTSWTLNSPIEMYSMPLVAHPPPSSIQLPTTHPLPYMCYCTCDITAPVKRFLKSSSVS